MRARNCAASRSTAPLPPCWPARIETLRLALETIGQTGIPIEKDKALNERMYGELQGLNKAETAKKYGEATGEDLAAELRRASAGGGKPERHRGACVALL